jgi:hypothetical protein
MIDRDSRLRPRSPSACTAQLWLELWSCSAYGHLLLRVLGSGYLRSRLYRVELEQGFCMYCPRWYFQQRTNTILVVKTGASPNFGDNQLVKLRASTLVAAMLMQK